MSISRRDVVKSTTLGLLGAAISSCSFTEGKGQKLPNILWLVSEDNNPLLGAYGDKLAHTPNLDALAQKGVLYRNAFSNAPVCAVSRFGILTGVYAESCSPAQHQRTKKAHLPEELKTYPEYLREAGYYCTNNSKTDYNCDVDPDRIWDESSPNAQWYNRRPGQPFMAVYNDYTTHSSQVFYTTEGRVKPEHVRVPAYLPDTPEIRRDFASYYNRIEIMDKNCGDRLAQIERMGATEDTIVFYYSDHGGVQPRTKTYAYDEGFRAPLIIYVPPKWRHLAPASPGSEVSSPVSFIDLVPTLLSLVGRPKAPHMPGRALLGAHEGKPEQYAFGGRNRMDERYDFIRTVRDERYCYIRNYNPDRPWGAHMAFLWQAKGFQRWEQEHIAGKLPQQQDRFFQTKPYEEFYDLKDDPDQVNNLMDDPAQASQITAMGAALDQHMIEINDNGFIPEGAAAEGYFNSKNRTVYPLKKLMTLAEMAAQRNPANLEVLCKHLADSNEVVRYWAASGLRMLGTASMPCRNELVHMAEQDPSLNAQVVAAHAIVALGEAGKGVERLAAITDMDIAFPVRLQALNVLTLIGESAREALPAIRRAAKADNEYVCSVGRYLVVVFDGIYKPESQIFDFEKRWPSLFDKPLPSPLL